jgi:hypothetical protein
MLRSGDCRGVQLLKLGRLVYSLLTMQKFGRLVGEEVAQIGRSSAGRFATFWGTLGDFGTT